MTKLKNTEENSYDGRKEQHSHGNLSFKDVECNTGNYASEVLEHRTNQLEKSVHSHSYSTISTKCFGSTSEDISKRLESQFSCFQGSTDIRSQSHQLSYLQGLTDSRSQNSHQSYQQNSTDSKKLESRHLLRNSTESKKLESRQLLRNSTDITAIAAEKLKGIFISKDCSGSHSDTSGAERDSNDNLNWQSIESTAKMARTTVRGRRTISSIRVLSGSDSDSESLASSSFKEARQKSDRFLAPQLRSAIQSSSNNRLRVSGKNKLSYNDFSAENHVQESVSHREEMWGNSSAGYVEEENQSVSNDSSMNELCADKAGIFLYRWLMWKYTYLAICKCMHFDIKTLTRISSFGKKKTIFFLLLPLLLWLLAGIFFSRTSQVHFPSLSDVFYNSISYSMGTLLSFAFPVSYEKHEGNSEPKVQSLQHLMSWPDFSEAFNREEKQSSSQSVDTEKFTSSSVNVFRAELKLLVEELLKEAGVVPQYLNDKHANSLESTEEVKKVQDEINSLYSKFETLTATMQSVKTNFDGKIKTSDELRRFSVQQEVKLLQIDTQLQNLGQKFLVLENLIHSAKNCCRNHTDDFLFLQSHLPSLLSTISEEDKNVHPSLKKFHNWLVSNFVNNRKLSREISRLQEDIKKLSVPSTQHFEDLANKAAAAVVAEYIASVQKTQSTEGTYSGEKDAFFSRVQKIVKDALLLYDADKTGQTDYALESGGGSVVNTRCSETYSERSPRITILGFPIWYGPSTPRNAIQPDVHPGQCWAFKGSQGFLVIELAASIRPTGFVIEHIPKSLSPTGTINSAPKEFTVWGLVSDKDNEGKLLGKYTYDKDGDPLQYFPTQVDDKTFYSYIELKIHSNHGDLEYTCLYRFRVHGSRY